MQATITELCSSLVGEDGSLRALLRSVRIAGGGLVGGGMACSAVALALEDLWARQRGESLAVALGGPLRTDVRAYAASGGYIEGVHPRDTWADELAGALDLGFTAIKWRIGRYPIAEEAALLDKLRSDTPAEILFLADGNAAYTFKEAVRMGRILTDLGFFWYEEPMEQRGAYVGYDRLARHARHRAGRRRGAGHAHRRAAPVRAPGGRHRAARSRHHRRGRRGRWASPSWPRATESG